RRLIEYHGLAAVLDTTGATLDAAMGDPDLAEVSGSLRAATDAHPDAALLGAFVGPLLAHASADEELGLLRRARDLWHRGLAAAGELHTARIELEPALTREDALTPRAARPAASGTAGSNGPSRSSASTASRPSGSGRRSGPRS